MKYFMVSRSALEEASKSRPEGYVTDVLSKAQRQNATHIFIPAEDYRSLKEKYLPGGPGTELKKLLKSIGIEAKPNCSCNKRAQLMDQNEARAPGWCEANIEEISGWLQEEAHKRGLPYIASAGKLLIRMAIKRAKRGNGS